MKLLAIAFIVLAVLHEKGEARVRSGSRKKKAKKERSGSSRGLQFIRRRYPTSQIVLNPRGPTIQQLPLTRTEPGTGNTLPSFPARFGFQPGTRDRLVPASILIRQPGRVNRVPVRVTGTGGSGVGGSDVTRGDDNSNSGGSIPSIVIPGTSNTIAGNPSPPVARPLVNQCPSTSNPTARASQRGNRACRVSADCVGYVPRFADGPICCLKQPFCLCGTSSSVTACTDAPLTGGSVTRGEDNTGGGVTPVPPIVIPGISSTVIGTIRPPVARPLVNQCPSISTPTARASQRGNRPCRVSVDCIGFESRFNEGPICCLKSPFCLCGTATSVTACTDDPLEFGIAVPANLGGGGGSASTTTGNEGGDSASTTRTEDEGVDLSGLTITNTIAGSNGSLPPPLCPQPALRTRLQRLYGSLEGQRSCTYNSDCDGFTLDFMDAPVCCLYDRCICGPSTGGQCSQPLV